MASECAHEQSESIQAVFQYIRQRSELIWTDISISNTSRDTHWINRAPYPSLPQTLLQNATAFSGSLYSQERIAMTRYWVHCTRAPSPDEVSHIGIILRWIELDEGNDTWHKSVGSEYTLQSVLVFELESVPYERSWREAATTFHCFSTCVFFV